MIAVGPQSAPEAGGFKCRSGHQLPGPLDPKALTVAATWNGKAIGQVGPVCPVCILLLADTMILHPVEPAPAPEAK